MVARRSRPSSSSAAGARPAEDAADDLRLATAAADGDRGAFHQLYCHHLPAVYARLTLMIGPVPERDDLVQQIFLDVYQALPRFRGEARFSTFLHRITVNVACDHLERGHRGRQRQLPLADEDLDRLVAPGASPEARAQQRQELAQVFEHLEAVRPKKRVAFVLVAVQGVSLEQAAELLGASAETVKQRVLHARKEISARLARAAARARARTT